MKARHKDTGEIIELAEEGIISRDGRRFCWYQVELIPEPIDECKPSLPSNLDSLQQEQPEVDLEKELNRYLRGEFKQTAGGNFNNYIQVARHFYELGRNTRKEEWKWD